MPEICLKEKQREIQKEKEREKDEEADAGASTDAADSGKSNQFDKAHVTSYAYMLRVALNGAWN